MENGQKANIPLDSGLDIKSSDMLVPVDKPQFQHNRQKYQGRYLPSSVRFEHNGWAAGNDVYEFDFAELKLDTDGMGGLINVFAKLYNDNPTYMLFFRDDDDNELFKLVLVNASGIMSSDCDDVSIGIVNDSVVISGRFNTNPFSITYNMRNNDREHGITVTGTGMSLSSCLQLPDYTNKITLVDSNSSLDINVPAVSFPTKELVNADNGNVVFGKFVSYNKGANNTSGSSVYACGSYTISFERNGSLGSVVVKDFNGNALTVEQANLTFNSGDRSFYGSFSVTTPFEDRLNIQWKKYIPFFKDMVVTAVNNQNMTIAYNANPDLTINKWNVQLTSVPAEFDTTAGHTFKIRHILPIPFTTRIDTRTAQKGYDTSALMEYTRGYQVVANLGSQVRDGVTWYADLCFGPDIWSEGFTNADYIGVPYYSTEAKNNFFRALYSNIAAYLGPENRPSAITPVTSITDSLILFEIDWFGTTDMSQPSPFTSYVGAQFWLDDLNITQNAAGQHTYSAPYWAISLLSVPVDELTPAMCKEWLEHVSGLRFSTSNSSPVGTLIVPDYTYMTQQQQAEQQQAVTSGFAGVVAGFKLDATVTVKSGQDTVVVHRSIWIEHDHPLGHDAVITKNKLSFDLSGDNILIQDTVIDEIPYKLGTSNMQGAVESEVYMTKNDGEFGTDCFAIVPRTVTSGYIDLSSQFKHQIVKTLCNEQLELDVYLASATSDVQYLYYVPDTESDIEYDVIPPYILYGTTDYTKLPAKAMKRITIKPDYSLISSRDTEYNLAVVVNGTPAKYNKDTFYRIAESIEDSLSNMNLMPGNVCTEVTVPSFVNNSEFRLFPVQISNWSGSSDYPPLGHRYQRISLRYKLSVDDSTHTKAYYYDIDDDKLYIGNARINSGGITETGFTYSDGDMTHIGDQEVSLQFNAKCAYNIASTNRVYLPKYVNDTFIISHFENNIAEFSTGGYTVFIDYDMREAYVRYSNAKLDCNELWASSADNSAVRITRDGSFDILCILRGIYDGLGGASGVEVYTDRLVFTINGEQLTVYTENMPATEIGCYFTNVQDKTLRSRQFAKIDAGAELQFLKQDWNTDNDVENFWWIDKDKILSLTKDKLLLKHRTDRLSDWDGDIFSELTADGGFSCDRNKVLSSSVLKYFCSSAYNDGSALFITVTDLYTGIDITVYNPSDYDNELDEMAHFSVQLELKAVPLGSQLNTVNNVKLCTYSDITTNQLISQSKWSATRIGNKLIIGIHYDNNFNQWAVLIDLNGDIESIALDKVIQGYGFVGIDGSLTGGEIPDDYFDVGAGFNDTVYPLSVLEPDEDDRTNNAELESIDKLWNITERVVGDAEQQWYIKKDLKGVVSHLEYSPASGYIKRVLPITNNYDVDYESASYATQLSSDFNLKLKAVKDAFPIDSDIWKGMLVSWLYPIVYYFNPAITVANYLQQALGQAAYVHYNSTSLGRQKDNVDKKDNNLPMQAAEIDHSAAISDEITFDRQTIKQTQELEEAYSSMLTIAASAVLSVGQWVHENISMVKNDEGKDALQVDFTGTKFSQFFTDNMRNSTMSDTSVNTIYSAKSVEVTAIKTLDMFYSTSDKQQICAGRGYVNHNFVAQCTVQSVNNMSANYLQQKFMFCLKELTLLPMQIMLKGLESIKRGLVEEVDASGGPNFVLVGVASGGTIPVAPGLAIGYLAADIACNYIQIGVELVTSMLESFGGGKLQTSISASLFKPYFHVEAKHRYGSKSESFMWPCFGTKTQYIKNESVDVVMQNKSWRLCIPVGIVHENKEVSHPDYTTVHVENDSPRVTTDFRGDVPFYDAMVKGVHTEDKLPANMAYVIGTESFLPETAFKNEYIGDSAPVFATPPFQDYIIDEGWQLAQTASVGMTTWVSCRDTKLIDGEFSNIVVTDDFCGVACPYTAIEVKRGIEKKYIRPWAVTPNAIALNNTGFNCMFEEKAYHAFDGYGSRIVSWMGSPGLGKEKQTLQYAFLVNDRFKRSNKLPPNEFMGNFKGDPDIAIRGDYNDSIFSLIMQPGENTGIKAGTVGEDKDVRRYALPVFSEFVNTLPAVIKTVSSQTLAVIDGVTSLTTANRDLQTAYKSPVSVDFSIGKNKYRYTYEYICSVENDDVTGVTVVTELVPCLGLKFVGSTPYEAYLYSDATRQYYKFTGGTSISSVDTIERFRDVISGRYDFISQEVVLPCVATFDRLDGKVHDDDDETDNVIVPRLKDNGFVGEVPPPLDTIYNKKFRTLSLPSGVAFQGPNRCIINRFVVQDYMVDQIKSNYGKWKRVSREEYHPFREYKEKFSNVETFLDDSVSVKGWTHNPFLLVTAPLGVDEAVDCMFEWEITFCWPVEMDKLYGKDNYAVVNITAETMTPGGKVVADRPAHVFLTKELFARSGNYGYYSFRYQSKCGIGNRERLHIWSDQYVCISGLQLEYKPLTQKRTEILTQQADLTGLNEI